MYFFYTRVDLAITSLSIVHFKNIDDDDDDCKKTQFKIECKGQTYKTAEIILLCYKVRCLFCTVTFTSELIAKRHSLSFHYKCDYSTNALITATQNKTSQLDHVVVAIAEAIRQWHRQQVQISDACFVHLLCAVFRSPCSQTDSNLWRIWRPQLRRNNFWSFFNNSMVAHAQ